MGAALKEYPWGHVAVEDDEGRATDDCVDAEDFQGVVGCRDARDVEVAEGDRVVYQNSQASTTATRSVLTDEIVITKGRATCRGGELGLLNTGDEDVVGFEEVSELRSGVSKAIAVVLEDCRWRRAGVWMESSDEEEEKN